MWRDAARKGVHQQQRRRGAGEPVGVVALQRENPNVPSMNDSEVDSLAARYPSDEPWVSEGDRSAHKGRYALRASFSHSHDQDDAKRRWQAAMNEQRAGRGRRGRGAYWSSSDASHLTDVEGGGDRVSPYGPNGHVVAAQMERYFGAQGPLVEEQGRGAGAGARGGHYVALSEEDSAFRGLGVATAAPALQPSSSSSSSRYPHRRGSTYTEMFTDTLGDAGDPYEGQQYMSESSVEAMYKSTRRKAVRKQQQWTREGRDLQELEYRRDGGDAGFSDDDDLPIESTVDDSAAEAQVIRRLRKKKKQTKPKREERIPDEEYYSDSDILPHTPVVKLIGGKKLYKNVYFEEDNIALNYVFDYRMWRRKYMDPWKGSPAKAPALRRIIQKGTLQALKERQVNILRDRQQVIVPLDERQMRRAVRKTLYYHSHTAFPQFDMLHRTTVHFLRADALDVAVFLKREVALNPVLVVNASPHKAGGTWEQGTPAQEESVYRRTNLLYYLEDPLGFDRRRKWSYRLGKYGAIYCPDVTVLRDSGQKGCRFLDVPEHISMIMASSLRNPAIMKAGRNTFYIGKADQKVTLKKIKKMFSVALENGHDTIVLSAWGCGGNNNPPNQMAELFVDVLFTKRFINRFKYVVFAIFDDEHSRRMNPPHLGRGNLNPFRRAFLDRVTEYKKHGTRNHVQAQAQAQQADHYYQ